MRDFTMEVYKQLLITLKDKGFQFIPFKDYFDQHASRFVILRHDVDAKKMNSLESARIEYQMGITGTYYFRVLPKSYDQQVIREIASMGHEIGYHYETMDTSKGNIDQAYSEFCSNLLNFRLLYPIITICMHGSPLSKYDNREIWKKYDYHSHGIIGEPYFDLDFSTMLYLTDTGRRWDGEKVSVRDKIIKEAHGNDGSDVPPALHLRHTKDIINALNNGIFPDKVMITVHPQRWNNNYFSWLKEAMLQNVKNQLKKFLIKRKRTL